MTKLATLSILALVAPALALAAPPRGKRTPRPRPTHLVITETALATGGAPGTLLPGVAVVAPSAAPTQKGKVKVTVTGPVEIAGTVDGAALGLRVGSETPFWAEDGKTALGKAHPGALVRVVGPGRPGQVLVETAGAFVVKGQVAQKSLTTEPGELVITVSWNYETAKVTELWADQGLKGKALVRLPEGVHLEYYEKVGDVAHVRTVAGVELGGWTPVANLRERAAPLSQPGPARLVQPTHEAFVDAPLYADVLGKKRLGTLRGGALVEVNARATRDARAGSPATEQAATVKVTTPGDVVVEGWMREADLRALSQKAISQ